MPLAGAIPPGRWASPGGEPELICATPQKMLLRSAGRGPAALEPVWSSLSASDWRHVYTASEMLPFFIIIFILIPALFREKIF